MEEGALDPPPDGVIVFAKPAGVTSHDIVARVRRALPRTTKVGHAGTLDPFATGVLLVLVGRATRAQRFLMDLPKSYRVVARLGWVSDTGDRDGELIHTGRVPADPQIPVGPQLQRPPAYSAVKVGGRRLYELARAGEAQEGDPRPVTVHRAELIERRGDDVTFDITCSSGTYVRQLVADLGDAYCEELERTAVGDFTVDPERPDRVVPLAEALAFLHPIHLAAEDARRVVNGIKLPAPEGTGEGPVRLMHGETLIAVARRDEALLRLLVVFAP